MKAYITTDMLAGLHNLQPGAAITVSDLEFGRQPLTDWQKSRLGKITGSQFDRIRRGQGGKGWSDGAESYLAEIVWEWVTGMPAHEFTSVQTDWGIRYESEAISLYERKIGRKVKRGKFYAASDRFYGLVGCTPDGVGEKALEVKCPYAPKAHIRTLVTQKVPPEYLDQVYGHMLCTGKDECDFVSYDPRFIGKRDDLAHIVITTEANAFYMEDLEGRLYDFEQELISRLDSLEIDWRKSIKK
jgi:predicted phage-related endonuclease